MKVGLKGGWGGPCEMHVCFWTFQPSDYTFSKPRVCLVFFGANTNVGKQRLWFMWSSSQKKKRNHIFVILQSGLARVFLNTVSQGRTRPNCFQLFAWTCGNRNFAFRSVSILSKWILRPASICWKACDHLLEDLQICLERFQACFERPATIFVGRPATICLFCLLLLND